MVADYRAPLEAPTAYEEVYPRGAAYAEWEAIPHRRRGPKVIRETLSRFPRYQHTVRALPPDERAKVERVARLVVQSYGPGRDPVRRIILVGHADRDVQRGAAYEKQVSGERAGEVRHALTTAINRLSGRPLASQIDWRLRHAGAGEMVVKSAVTERDRARNRRVEINLVPGSMTPYNLRRSARPSPRSIAMRQALLTNVSAQAEVPSPFPTPVTPSAYPTPGTFPTPWQRLISFRPSTGTQSYVNGRFGVRVIQPKVIHFIEDASGPINLDYYPVLVTTLPTLPGLGRPATAQEFLSYIRLNFNSFIDTALAFFEPYNPTIDGPKWRSPSPQDAVIHIDMRVGSQWANPDDGSVVTSEFAPDHWVFSTLWTPGDQAHPVSGNREFGFETRQDPNNPTGQVYILYTRGADRPTRVVDNVGSAIIFAMAHALWRSLQARIAGFANGNGGAATVLTPISRRFDWSRVKPFYFAPTVPRL